MEVRQVAASVELTAPDDTLAEGEIVQLAAAVADPNAVAIPDPAIEWTSSDATVASVDADGTVTGGRGDAVVS